jgi:ubiquinone/menaquinone biosynthesis C-methylase UbiE
MEYKIHPVEWTDEKVARFWNFQNQYEPFENVWFTKQVGAGIVNLINSKIKISGKILDYGTGKGHLVKHLLELQSGDVYGFDFSEESIRNVNGKYNSFGNYKGTTLIGQGKNFTSFDDNSFDVVFLIEAIEHLTDKYLETTLAEINRILKKGGYVVVTTPNNENLPVQHVLCPDCGALFHRVQHVRKFDVDELQQTVEKHSFATKHLFYIGQK